MKENQQQITDMARLTMTICRNEHKLLQSFVKIYLVIKTLTPVSSSKDLQKAGRGSIDYHTENNSGIIVIKWVHIVYA